MAKDEKSGAKRSRRDRGRDKAKPPTKIVMRHLPPSMTEEEFLKQIDPLPDHDFYYFAEADWSLGFDATCRAYITFKNYDDVFLFRDRFDGYVFVDNKGNEYVAIVEFAPFQGFVKNKSRNSDNKVNTIEQESHYQQFLKKLEEEREAAAKGGETKLEFSLDSKKEEITSTPLLQYLATKREKRRDDAKKRSAEKKRRREEEKEKRKQNQATPQIIKVLASESSNKKIEKVEPNNQTKDPKNARARRREQRNRLRHEAYLQKKQAGHNSTTEKESSVQLKKEEENKKDTEKDINNETKSSTDTNKSIETLDKTKTHELTESVRNFILTASTNIQVATSDTKTDDENKTQDKSKSLEDLSDVRDKLSNMDLNKKSQKIDEKREERRIRNKDRPSIAIYQPKPRFRLPEENDSNLANRDFVRSQSVSDCETVKKNEEPRHKKVQRYSERSKIRKSNKETSQEEQDESQNQTQSMKNELSDVTYEKEAKTDTQLENEFCNTN